MHVESSVKIYFSKDYSLFRMINGNRQLNETKIKRIKTDINAGIDVLKYCPLIVTADNGLLHIIDGQHRFWVAKEMKRPVYYVVSDNLSLYDIAKINSNTEKWNNYDYINCYVQQGNENYIVLRDFYEKHHLPFSVCLHLLAKGYINADGGYSGMQPFKRGQFKVEHLKEAEFIASICEEFKEVPFWRERIFIIAISKIVQAQKCDLKELIGKFKKDPSQLTMQKNFKDYLTNLENILNKGAHNRRVVY